MKLESQVASFKQSMRLKELGVVQGKSIFVYDNRGICLFRVGELGKAIDLWVDAFTVAELGLALPYYIKDYGYLQIQKTHWPDWAVMYGLYGIQHDGEGISKPDLIEQEESLSDSMAAMLIHLIENNLITVEEVNKRLEGA